MTVSSEGIKTPDQRLRVFVSSTLQELAPERASARQAIGRIHMTPVLFELGARPYPPSELYRAYLDQSDIFIGIYWESYGWVAPDMQISGIEDEYLHAGDMPKLIYLKHPAPGRESRLGDLISRIRDDNVSYKPFRDPDELEDLISNDLALLLTERFAATQTHGTSRMPKSNLPALFNSFFGRKTEKSAVELLLREGETRLVTLTGPGGVGKSRLALELGRSLQPEFPDGSYLVMLQSIRDPELVASQIAHTLEVDEARSSPLDAVIAHIGDRRILLLIDNFEQVVEARNVIVQLLMECPNLSLLVTSREVLNVRGEQEFPLSPLATPPAELLDLTRVSAYEGVRLFEERAAAAFPGFQVNGSNVHDIAEIVRRLDGLPLAIELAAARARVLPPDALRSRLQDRFQLLQGGWHDLPERHHTLEATIAWSYDLLSPEEQRLMMELAVFNGGSTLEAIEAVSTGNDSIVLLASLLEKSLVRLETGTTGARYSMLETIHEYAKRKMAEGGITEEMNLRHACYYLEISRAAGPGMRSSQQGVWLDRLSAEMDNLRKALAYFIDGGRVQDATEMVWMLWQHWWLRDHLEEGRRTVARLLDLELDEPSRARALAVEGIMAFWQNDYGSCMVPLVEAHRLFTELNDEVGIAIVELPLGIVETSMGDSESARIRFTESREIVDRLSDDWGSAIARIALCWLWVGSDVDVPESAFHEAVNAAERAGTRVERGMALGNMAAWQLRHGQVQEAKRTVIGCMELLLGTAVRSISTYAIDIVAEIALLEGRGVDSARFFGAGDAIRMVTGTPLAPVHADRHARLLDEVRSVVPAELFVSAYESGAQLGYGVAMREALAWCAAASHGEMQDLSPTAELL